MPSVIQSKTNTFMTVMKHYVKVEPLLLASLKSSYEPNLKGKGCVCIPDGDWQSDH